MEKITVSAFDIKHFSDYETKQHMQISLSYPGVNVAFGNIILTGFSVPESVPSCSDDSKVMLFFFCVCVFVYVLYFPLTGKQIMSCL